MNYKKISTTIRWIYAALVVLVLAVVIVAELNAAPIEGALVGAFDARTTYVVEVGMLFSVGVCLLLALRGFDRVMKSTMRAASPEKRPKAYVGIYCVRLALLALPMLLGTYFYYALLENWGLYYALAAFVASLFCLPSPDGVEEEMSAVSGEQ